MKQKLRSLSKSEGVRQSVLTIGGNLAAVSMSAVAMMLISRSLGPTLYGEFSVGFALILILSRILDLGLVPALQRFIPQSTTQVQNKLFSLTIFLKLGVSIIVIVLGLLISPWLNTFFHLTHQQILPLAFILSTATVFYEQVVGMLQSLHAFGRAVTANLIQAAAKATSAIVIFFTLPSAIIPAFVSYMAAPFLGVLAAPFLLPKSVAIKWETSFSQEKNLIKTMAGHAAIGYVAAGMIEHVDVLFVQKFLTSYETGLLGGASRIALLVLMAGYSLASVLNPRVSRYATGTHLTRYWKKALAISALSLTAFLLWIPFNKLAITYTIGPEYLPSASVLLILMASSFLAFASIPLIAVFFALPKKEWYFSLAGIAQLAVILVGNYLFVADYGIIATAWVRLASKAVLFILTLCIATYAIKKHATH